MARNSYARCRVCGRGKAEGIPISWQGYCIEHGTQVRNQANDEMHFHSGPYFQKWRRAMAASVGGILVDDLLGEE